MAFCSSLPKVIRNRRSSKCVLIHSELTEGCPSSMNLQMYGRSVTGTTFTKTKIDAILTIFKDKMAVDLQVARSSSESE